MKKPFLLENMVSHIVNKVKINSVVVFVFMCQRLLNICLGLVLGLFSSEVFVSYDSSTITLVRTIDGQFTSLLRFLTQAISI